MLLSEQIECRHTSGPCTKRQWNHSAFDIDKSCSHTEIVQLQGNSWIFNVIDGPDVIVAPLSNGV